MSPWPNGRSCSTRRVVATDRLLRVSEAAERLVVARDGGRQHPAGTSEARDLSVVTPLGEGVRRRQQEQRRAPDYRAPDYRATVSSTTASVSADRP